MSLPNDIHALRNIGIIAHIDAGKTTLSERILFYTKKIRRMGEVHEGTATMDYLPEEQERGITITSACTTCLWRGHVLNLIDTPGHVDFTIEVERALRVLDGAVGVFCAVGGVEPQSETVWRQSEILGVPKIAFINKMDKAGADFAGVLQQLRERLDANPLPLTIPAGEGEDFEGVIDLLMMEKLIFTPEDQGRTIRTESLSPAEREYAETWRYFLLEGLADADDLFMTQYLNEQFTPEDIRASLRRATLSRRATPVLCGSALRNSGVQPLLDAVAGFLPSPAEAPYPLARTEEGGNIPVEPDTEAEPVALVFKSVVECGERFSFLRLYAGHLAEGETLFNVNTGGTQHIEEVFRPHADHREHISKAAAGEIVAVTGLHAGTGDTFTGGKKLLLEPIHSYEPVITLALEPLSGDDSAVLDQALLQYTQEDPTLLARVDEESGMRMLSGMGELHLTVILERLRREHGISPRVGNPQVVLRETVRNSAEGEGRFSRDPGLSGRVRLSVFPLPRSHGNQVEFDAGQDHPEFREAVQEGINDALSSGPLTGYPVQDVRLLVTGIEGTPDASLAAGYRMAAAQATREALTTARPLSLEPVMRVEITVPDAQLGAAINLVNICGGSVDNLLDQMEHKIIQGTAPLRQLFGFATSLRSATRGRAGVVMTFERYDLVS